MKLGIINGWEKGHIEYVHNKGLSAIEFCVNHNYDAAEFLEKAEQTKHWCDEYGVSVGSIGRWGMTRIDSNGQIIPQALEADKSLITAAGILNCPVYNCGVNPVEGLSFYENCRIAIDYLGQLIAFGKEKNVKIAVYTCNWENFVIEPTAWNVVLSALPELGIKYDISHCLWRGGDYLQEMLDWGDRFYHFHLKGAVYVNGKHYDDAPAGLDMIPWPVVMDILYTKNYDGMLSIEPHSIYWHGNKGQWGVDFTINHFKPMLMPENYECANDPYMP